MRLVTFVPPRARRSRPGVLVGDRVVDLPSMLTWARRSGYGFDNLGWCRGPVPSTVVDFLARGSSYLDQCSAWISGLAVDEVFLGDMERRGIAWPAGVARMRAPLEHPPSIRDFMAFEGHIKTLRGRHGLEVAPAWYQIPIFYFTNAGTVYGPSARVPRPRWCLNLDYELEIACVIGTGGTNISEQEAEGHIAGFTIYNDWSARDLQAHEMQIGLGTSKGKDFAQSLGPCILTLDEVRDRFLGDGRYDLAMTARVNGITYSRGNFRDIFWTFPQMIAHASRNSVIYPGDVFGSGTVGTGCLAEIGADRGYDWLRPGDVVELEIERIGVLRNVVGKARRHSGEKMTRPAYLQNVRLSV